MDPFNDDQEGCSTLSVVLPVTTANGAIVTNGAKQVSCPSEAFSTARRLIAANGTVVNGVVSDSTDDVQLTQIVAREWGSFLGNLLTLGSGLELQKNLILLNKMRIMVVNCYGSLLA